MKTIALIRHGQASFGTDRYDQLSALGERQTAYLGQFFQQSQQQVDLLISGEMQRQQASLQHFCQGYQNPQAQQLPSHAGLNEFDHEEVLFKAGLGFQDHLGLQQFLASQAKPHHALMTLFDRAVARWQSGEYDADYRETWRQFQQRSWQALQDVIVATPEQGYTLIFTSGGVIACILQQILQLTPQQAFAFNLQIANASMTHLLVKQDKIQIQSLNEFRYLYTAQRQDEPSLITWR